MTRRVRNVRGPLGWLLIRRVAGCEHSILARTGDMPRSEAARVIRYCRRQIRSAVQQQIQDLRDAGEVRW